MFKIADLNFARDYHPRYDGRLPEREAHHLPKFSLVLLIHAHQPIGNFDEVMEHTYARSYLPFVDCLARHPQVRMGLHYSGCLLEWLAEHHPEYLDRIPGPFAGGHGGGGGGGVL